MSDDDSSAASSATPDLSNVVLDDVPLPNGIKNKYETEIKMCVHYNVDFSQFSGKGSGDFRKSDFTKAWKSAKGVEIERRTTSRTNAGQLLEALSRCDQCDACQSLKVAPPGCQCGACRGNYYGACSQVLSFRLVCSASP